jgi:hypothetical protein
LGPVAVEAPRVAAVVGERVSALGDERRDVDQVQARGEVVPVRDEHAGPQGVVVLQQGVRQGQVDEHGHVEGVALARSVQPHHQDVPVALEGHGLQGGIGGGGHGWSELPSPRLCKRP